MSRHYQSLARLKYHLLFVLVICLLSCKNTKSTSSTFSGDAKAVEHAEQMFEAIGGKSAWCNLRSVYIKAEHTEPQMTIPYTSEIWRDVANFELIIEQQNDSFHVKGIFNNLEGTIRYYDQRDTTRSLSVGQIAQWNYDHNHNIYVILHNLGCQPENYTVEIDDQDRLTFHQDSTIYTALGLDEELRPHLFYHPNTEGILVGSTFTHWAEDEGLIHSAGGHPLDSSFFYKTEIWQPSDKTLRETYGDEIFKL